MMPTSLRFRPIDRDRVSTVSLDRQLPQDHPVRDLWSFVLQLDLDHFQRPNKATLGHPGAPIIPTQLLFALWLQATSEGVTSARQLAELCSRDLVYQWLCGGMPVNYHTLADFYSDHANALHDLFVSTIAALRQHDLIDLSELTLDGRKIPAHAAKESFHREPTLQRHLAEAEEHLKQLQSQRDEPSSCSARQAAARLRAAHDRQSRLKQAVEQVQIRQKQREATNRANLPPEEARASETDPDAVKMKRADGGYRACYNTQTLATTAGGLIVSVLVTNQSCDNGLLRPMLEQLEQEQGVLPERVLADAGYSDLEDVAILEGRQVEVLMPPKNERKEQLAGGDPYAAKRRDKEEVARWRGRLGTAEGRAIYRRRAPVAEGVHAQQSNRGWQRYRLRGIVRAGVESCWQAMAHNLLRLRSLGLSWTGMVRAEMA